MKPTDRKPSAGDTPLNAPADPARIRYYVHDNKPARVTEPHGGAPRAEYLNPDGTLTDADYWTVTVEGTETPEHIVLDFWQRHRPDIA